MALRSDLRASDPFEFVCRFVPGRSLYGRRPRPATILRAKRRVQGPRPDPGPLRPFSGMPGRRRRRVTRRTDSPQVSSCPCVRRRGGAAKRPIVPSVAVVESFEGKRILVETVEILREVPGERVLGRAYPQPLPRRRVIGYRGGLRTARVYHPQCGRMPRQSATMPISGRKDVGSSPHSRPPTLGEMCASFTGIKYTFHCAAIKCDRSAIFFPRKTSETWYKHLFQNYRFAYFGAFVSHLY